MEDSLTVREAYQAMYSYLENLYHLTKSDFLGATLGGMSFLQDGGTADPAIWGDWLKAVEKAKRGEVDSDLRLG